MESALHFLTHGAPLRTLHARKSSAAKFWGNSGWKVKGRWRSFRLFTSRSSEKFPGVERNVWKVSPLLIVRSRRNVSKGNLSSLLVKPSVWYQFWALNLKEFLLISLNGKCDSRTSCLTFTQTVNRPLCPRKLGKQPSFPQKETYHWIKGEDISNGCSRQLLFNDNGKVL